MKLWIAVEKPPQTSRLRASKASTWLSSARVFADAKHLALSCEGRLERSVSKETGVKAVAGKSSIRSQWNPRLMLGECQVWSHRGGDYAMLRLC